MIEIGPYRFTDDDARATLRHAGDLFDALVDGLPDDIAEEAAPFRQRALAAAGSLESALRQYWVELRAAGEAIRASGVYGEAQRGIVLQLNTSGGGVPKLPVDRVDVGYGGLAGDVQATRRHHGRPWQALCLWSAEVIDDFAADGHPIGYGNAGENITVAGLDWAQVRPGIVLHIGTVACEVTAFALPCAQNARWFRGGDFNLMHHRRGAVSRAYALVTTPGSIATGDAVVAMPG